MSVLVTGIGGNVGQGVLRIIRPVAPHLCLVGTDMILPCGGSHLCDRTYATPHASSPRYLGAIREICSAERVELILPCTDVEAYRLACDLELPALVSPAATQLVFLDKYLTGRVCADAGIPFAPTVLPSAYAGEFSSTVVKEREGRGSRGLHYDPPDVAAFGDDFVVQERLFGPEITVAFYTTQEGRVHGFLAMVRELGHGTTMLATVTRDFDAILEPMIARLSDVFDVCGSCNVQAIVVGNGEVVPFEINGRISGSASIRHSFGFRDVEYAVQEYLLSEHPRPIDLETGTAARLLMDVVYRGKSPTEVRDVTTPHEVF